MAYYVNYGNYYKSMGGSKCCNLANSGQTGPTGPQGNIGPTGPAGVSVSDARDKTDINTLEPSMAFLRNLEPVRFKWNMRKNEEIRGQADIGFIAQQMAEVQAATGIAVPGLVDSTDPEYLLANYNKLLPLMVGAIKELDARVQALEGVRDNASASA